MRKLVTKSAKKLENQWPERLESGIMETRRALVCVKDFIHSILILSPCWVFLPPFNGGVHQELQWWPHPSSLKECISAVVINLMSADLRTHFLLSPVRIKRNEGRKGKRGKRRDEWMSERIITESKGSQLGNLSSSISLYRNAEGSSVPMKNVNHHDRDALLFFFFFFS